MDTTPVITATTSDSSLSKGIVKVSTDWDSGNPAYEVFNVFRQYLYPQHDGIIDISNLYKLLYEAGSHYDNAISSSSDSDTSENLEKADSDSTAVQELASATEILPPFDFGNTARSYTHASNNYALSTDGDTVYAILTWIWDEDPTYSYGVIEGSFNSTSGDLTLDMVYLVDYEGDSDYCLRTYITGNDTTHQFTVKLSKYNTGENAYAMSMIGTGVSQSDDENDYFLLKMKDNDNLSEYTNGRYFRFAADSDEDALAAASHLGYDYADIEDANNYADTLDGMTFFALDGSDHATSVSDFTNSDLTLDY
jgi:hypothetical protein